jgi:polyisoprenoid-binding protein YceI
LIQRYLLLLAACVVVAACSAPPDAAPSTRLVTSSPVPGGSPEPATPTAVISRPAPPVSPSPSPSPVALASPSPAAVSSPAASPIAVGVASPVADAGLFGPRYAIVSERSAASYHARETFVSRGFPSDAVGTTNDVSGEIQLDSANVLRGQVTRVTVDLRTLASDQDRRDAFIRQNTLQTDQYPFAEFRSTELAGPASYRPGDEATFHMGGIMTVHGQERPVVWDAVAKLDGDTLIGTATTRIKLSDFGIEPPRLAILSVEDEMTWQIDIVAQRVP